MAARAVSNTDAVPRLPMPWWMYTLPSGRMVSSPSMPDAPAVNALSATPMPVTRVPSRRPLFARMPGQSNASAPASAASRTNALDTFGCTPWRGWPNSARPAGALIRIMSSWSIFSRLAALCISGAIMETACRPPGARCAARGGVLV